MHIWIGTNKMIIRRETLNEISTLKHEGFSVWTIASMLNVAAEDVINAIKSFKL
jgi:hypothetical protein